MTPSYAIICGSGSAGLAWAPVATELGALVLPAPDVHDVPAMAAALAPAIAALARPRVLIGTSLGALLALELAGDTPVDALILVSDPTFPGCHIRVRPIGVFWMEDEKGPDAKVLTVPVSDPVSGKMTSIEDLEAEQRNEIEHFFTIYKDLEPGKQTSTRGWSGPDEARATIEDARLRAQRPDSHL